MLNVLLRGDAEQAILPFLKDAFERWPSTRKTKLLQMATVSVLESEYAIDAQLSTIAEANTPSLERRKMDREHVQKIQTFLQTSVNPNHTTRANPFHQLDDDEQESISEYNHSVVLSKDNLWVRDTRFI
jgi:hypothetical protein